MACSYRFLEGTLSELDGVIRYLNAASGGNSASRTLIEHVNSQIELICENPPLYPLSRMPELAALRYHAALVDSYVMLYFYRDGCVYVAHFFHQRQDYARLV